MRRATPPTIAGVSTAPLMVVPRYWKVSEPFPRLMVPSATALSVTEWLEVAPAARDGTLSVKVRPLTWSPDDALTIVRPRGIGIVSEMLLTSAGEGFCTSTASKKLTPSTGVEGLVEVW